VRSNIFSTCCKGLTISRASLKVAQPAPAIAEACFRLEGRPPVAAKDIKNKPQKLRERSLALAAANAHSAELIVELRDKADGVGEQSSLRT
jgi:hypothetical protein